jgi:hypothetical protein
MISWRQKENEAISKIGSGCIKKESLAINRIVLS